MWYQQMDVVFQHQYLQVGKKELGEYHRSTFYNGKWSVEKRSLLKIMQKEGAMSISFSFKLASIFKCYFTVESKHVEELMYTCKDQQNKQELEK